MSKQLTDQLRAYFDDVDRQQGAVDIDALRRSVEERVVTIELSPDKVEPPNGPTSGRRWPILTAAAAVLLVIVVALVVRDSDDQTPADQPSPTVTVPPTSPPQALVDLPDGMHFAPGTYFIDEVDGTPTPRILVTIGDGWRDTLSGDGTELTMTGPDPIAGVESADLGGLGFSRPSAVFADACHWKDGDYPGSVTTVDGLVAALTEQGGWAEVNVPSDISVDGYVGKRIRRIAPSDRSDCDTMPMDYSPRIPQNHSRPYPAFRSWENRSGGGPFEPGEIQILWILDIDGTVVVINTTQWVPTAAARDEFATVLDSIRIHPWSPELTAGVLESPFDCSRYCPNLAASPDGTLVAYDSEADTLTWYDDEPRVVPLSVDLGYSTLIAIGPHDIAYILQRENFAAVAPSGEVITGKEGRLNRPVYPTAAGLVVSAERWTSPNREPWMPWVDLDGNAITDTRPYPTAEPTDAGIAVRLGEREWLLPELSGNPPPLSDFLDLSARSDGGVVIVAYTSRGTSSNLFELMPDGTIERYFVEFVNSMRPFTVLPDGSLIVEHGLQLVHLTPPA